MNENSTKYQRLPADMDNMAMKLFGTSSKNVNVPRSNVNKNTPQSQGDLKKSICNPKLEQKPTLLELSGRCANLQVVTKEYTVRSEINVDDVFTYGHKKCSDLICYLYL